MHKGLGRAVSEFSVQIPVRFAHCDPASIVFYPRYFEMINQVVEDWFGEALGEDFKSIHVDRHLGVPTVNIECEFLRPSRLGEVLTFLLWVEKIGNSSFTIRIIASAGDERKLKARITLVFMSQEPVGAHPIPQEIKQRMAAFLHDQSN